MTESFWAIPNISEIRTPVTILKEQADALTNATDGLLKGEVSPIEVGSLSSAIFHGFNGGSQLFIIVPFLKNYRVNLIDYYHEIVMYPGVLAPKFQNEGGATRVDNEEDFVHALKKILSSNNTKMIVAGLISQAKAA